VGRLAEEIEGRVEAGFLEALGTLTSPNLLLEEMALRADKDSQQSFMVRITDNLFSRNSLSDIRRLYWLKSARWMSRRRWTSSRSSTTILVVS